ncbi:MAG: hypothetical protein KAU90_09075 [Sulfurovaceae bacterium]|nr:hypothetical protein [Sulfurovaceae bacterium]
MTNWKSIKRDYEKGMSYNNLAQKYKIKVNTIKSRKQREGWSRNIKDETVVTIRTFSTFEEGYSPEELLAREEVDDKLEVDLLKQAKYALFALAMGKVKIVKQSYNSNNDIISSEVKSKPPMPTVLNQLEILEERIAQLTIFGTRETDEEKEARYLAYMQEVKEQKEHYESRDIEEALREV